MRIACFAHPLIGAALGVAFVQIVGCGGRTGFSDDGVDLDAVPADTSFETGDDATVDSRADADADVRVDSTIDTRPDSILFDSRPDSILFDSRPDSILFDTPPDSFDAPPIDTGIDSAPDVNIDSGVDSTIDSDLDSGFDGGFDSGIDTGTDAPVDTGILCGFTSCDPATQVCCASFGGSLACVTKGTCGGIPIDCSSSASCPSGDVCCLDIVGGAPKATCVASCPGFQLCATDAECTPPRACRPLIGPYRSCR